MWNGIDWELWNLHLIDTRQPVWKPYNAHLEIFTETYVGGAWDASMIQISADLLERLG